VSSGAFPPSTNEHLKEDLSLRLKKLTHAAPCMLFMKGTPQEPRCGKKPILMIGTECPCLHGCC
jgi:hypothetical protein